MSCSLLFMGCRHDDVLENDPNQSRVETGLKGKSFVVTQAELEAKYAGNKSLNNILQKEFKTDNGLIKTNSVDEEAAYGVYIDLDYVTVFESDQIHTITYHVRLEEQEETDEIQEVYNLMYFSHDYETYYVTLLRYDFSQISFQEFVMNPDIYRAQLAFLPLNDIENIYKNIRYSFSNVNQAAGKTAYNYEVAVGLQRLEYQPCAVTTNTPGKLCKYEAHEHGDDRCTVKGDGRATPGYTTIDSRPCYGAPGSGAPDGHGGGGSVGSPGGGGGGGYTPVRPNPINSNPVKRIGDLFKDGLAFFQISIGNTEKNLDVLKGIVDYNLPTLEYLYSKASSTQEHGHIFTKQMRDGKYVSVANQVPLPLQTGSNWALNINDYVKIAINTGFLHTHTNKYTITRDKSNKEVKADPMFSHSDLRAIFRIGKEESKSNKKELYDLFVGLMTSESLYVVMFPNGTTKSTFQSVANGTPFSYYINSNEIWEKVAEELKDQYSNITFSTEPEPIKAKMYEKALLKVLKKNNVPLNFYRLDANNGQFNGSWKLLGLDASGNVTENQGY